MDPYLNRDNHKNHDDSMPGDRFSLRESKWPMATVWIVFILMIGILFYQCTPERILKVGEKSVDKATKVAATIVDAFNKENITTTLADRLTSISDSHGGRLEVAKISSIEQFKRTSSNWRGTTMSEIRVPAVFTYSVSLTDAWTVETRESKNSNVCVIIAPSLSPNLPVPILTHKMEMSSEEGWLRWDGEEEMDALTREITPHLNRRARLKIKLARDKARVTIADFIKNWLLQEDHWRTDRYSVIQVIFEDEFKPNNKRNEIKLEPTITLEKISD